MQTEFRKDTAKDRAAVIDFANYVFSHAHGSIDFPQNLPKLYGPDGGAGADHLLACEDGQIKAMVGVFFDTVHISNQALRVGGIGTVSVHPYARGKGYMKTLMRMADEEMRAAGAQLSMLGGQRQRYQHFGYELGGARLSFRVTDKSLFHACAGKTLPKLKLKLTPLTDADVPFCRALYSAQPVHFAREQYPFADILRSWGCAAFVIRENGRPCGYLTRSWNAETVDELLLEREELLPAVMAAYLAQFGRQALNLTVQPWETGRAALADEISEDCTLSACEMFRVYDWAAVLGSLLSLKAACRPLPDGVLTLDIGGELLELAVRGGAPAVRRLQPGEASAALTLEPQRALRLLCSPMGGYCPALCAACPAADAWFPLPLGFSAQDGV